MVEPLKMDYAVNDAEVIAAFKRQQNELEKERKARVDLQKQINDNAAAQKAADKSATETAKAFAAEQAKLASAAAKIAESVRTPLQAYKVGLSELVDHYKSGRLTQEEYLAAGDKLKEQYRDQAGITAQVAAAQREVAETAKAAKIEQEKLVAAAAKIADSVRTPIQEYKAKLAEVSDHYKAGRLNAEQYALAVGELKSEYQDASGMTARLTEAEKKKNDEIKSAQRIIEANLTAQQKYERNIAQITDLHKNGRLTLEQYNAAVAAEKTSLDKSSESGDKFGGVLGGLGTKIAGAAAGFASMGTVISFIKAEYDALLERQGKSKDANITLAAEQEALLMNLGGADAQQVTGDIKTLSKQSGVKEENVTRAVNEAMAARGDLGVDAVVKAVGSVSKIRKFAPSEMAGLAAATIDTQKQTGLGTDESLGFLLQMQGQARTKNLKGLAENFTPAVGGVMNFGADRQTAGAMLAALSHGMGDTTGAMTATSAIQLSKQLREFTGGKDIGESITQLQKNPEMRKKFLEGSSFEAKALPAIESLLSGGVQAQQFSAAKSALSQDPTKALEAAIAARNLPAIDIAQQDMTFANIVDQQRLADTKGAASSVNRERLAEIRKQAGQFGITGAVQTAAEDVMSGGQRTSQQTLGALDAEIKRLQAGATDKNFVKEVGLGVLTGGLSGFSTSGRMKETAQSEESKQLVALLTEMRDLAKQQLDQQEANRNIGGAINRAKNQNEGVL